MNFLFSSKINLRFFFLSVTRAITSRFFTSTSKDSLYKRISPLGNPSISIIPVLDQWHREGNTVDREELRRMIRELRKYNRFKHALEISQWMTDKMYIPLSCSDLAARLNLIFKVHGLEKAENYFNDSSGQLKGFEVYTAMLNCYAQEKSVEKAEILMQKMRDMGLMRTMSYNIMINLYYNMGDHEKIDALMLEMEDKGIHADRYTFGIRLSAYAAALDVEGVEKIINIMESDPQIVLDFNTYAIAANGYLKVGLIDKAMTMLKKLEGVVTDKRSSTAFDLLLKLYAEAGKKDHVYHIWKLYKKKRKIFNKGYKSMISSLLTLGDIEGAEKTLGEWESRKAFYDFQLPRLLIDAYCRKGLLEKAESLINHAEIYWGVTSVDACYSLARGYLEHNHIPKAVEAMKKAISVCPPNWNPSKEILATCVEYMEGIGDMEGADSFLKSLRDEGILSVTAMNTLMNHIKGEK